MAAPHPNRLLRRIRTLTGLFIAGLLISGATVLPLVAELNWLVDITGARQHVDSAVAATVPDWAAWLVELQESLTETRRAYPQLFYGTDWLAFGHLAIAIAFVGAWRNPARNRWLFDFGLIACALVIPWAIVFGAIRGIPWEWRLFDCGFGILGAIPLWLCRTWVRRLQPPDAEPPGF